MFESAILLGGELPLYLFKLLVIVIMLVVAGLLFVDEIIEETNPKSFRRSLLSELPQRDMPRVAADRATAPGSCKS